MVLEATEREFDDPSADPKLRSSVEVFPVYHLGAKGLICISHYTWYEVVSNQSNEQLDTKQDLVDPLMIGLGCRASQLSVL